jgi:hypothetical protein
VPPPKIASLKAAMAGTWRRQSSTASALRSGTASYCYEAQLFDEHTFGVVRSGVQHWRDRFRGKLQAVIDQHRPRLPATAEQLSGMILAVFEGSFILSRILVEPHYIAEQLGQYWNYLQLLFAPGASPVDTAGAGRRRPSRSQKAIDILSRFQAMPFRRAAR